MENLILSILVSFLGGYVLSNIFSKKDLDKLNSQLSEINKTLNDLKLMASEVTYLREQNHEIQKEISEIKGRLSFLEKNIA
jgi:predicted  nucleic acid-binding Zn-ribbon protein